MSKELKPLEALCYLDDIAHGRKMSLDPHELKLIIEKSLKALNIIKGKRVDIYLLILAINLYEDRALNYYNCSMPTHHLSKEEYDLIKEVLV